MCTACRDIFQTVDDKKSDCRIRKYGSEIFDKFRWIFTFRETNLEEDGDSDFAPNLNQGAMEAITQLDGIEEMEITRMSALYMQSDPAVLWPYAKQFARWVREDDPAAVKEKMEAYQAGAGQFERTEAVTLEQAKRYPEAAAAQQAQESCKRLKSSILFR